MKMDSIAWKQIQVLLAKGFCTDVANDEAVWPQTEATRPGGQEAEARLKPKVHHNQDRFHKWGRNVCQENFSFSAKTDGGILMEVFCQLS